ncbi:hypothetical protein [Pelagibius sp. Alg239-R121]|uniref:hypothetical protein n=1 Tax=Pelagibius sp. Alg239-R121 TaxID=2993448 RepID=UPI0024A74E06|nr:hypothetical protein [Pelagibius sp. Alg239-R121]
MFWAGIPSPRAFKGYRSQGALVSTARHSRKSVALTLFFQSLVHLIDFFSRVFETRQSVDGNYTDFRGGITVFHDEKVQAPPIA